MKRMILFECKKILRKRITMAGLGLFLALDLFLTLSSCLNLYAYDEVSGKEAHGMDALRLEQEISKRYEGFLTDEIVQQMLLDFQPSHDLHGMNVAYLYQNSMQASVHARFSDMDGNWNGQTVEAVFGKERLRIGYIHGWLLTSQNMIRLAVMLIMLLLFLTAPVFSGEYGGMDSLILACRYGRSRCGTAKNIAALTVSVLIVTGFLLFDLSLAFLIYGSKGLDCHILFAPQEFIEASIPFPITCGSMLWYQVLLIYTAVLGTMGVTLLLSALCKNPLITSAASAAFFFLPVILSIPETSAWYRLIVLLPFYQLQFRLIMSVEQMKGGILYAVWAVPMSLFLGILGIFISCRVFAKHQTA